MLVKTWDNPIIKLQIKSSNTNRNARVVISALFLFTLCPDCLSSPTGRELGSLGLIRQEAAPVTVGINSRTPAQPLQQPKPLVSICKSKGKSINKSPPKIIKRKNSRQDRACTGYSRNKFSGPRSTFVGTKAPGFNWQRGLFKHNYLRSSSIFHIFRGLFDAIEMVI